MQRSALPQRLVPALCAGGVLVGASTLTRLLLALRPDHGLLGWAELVRAFALGLYFDLAACAYLLTPLVLWLALAPNAIARSRVHQALLVAAFAAVGYFALLLAAAEWLFWDEFGGRFNFIAVDYLIYTHEVLGNIWQSYPVGWTLLAIAALAALLTWPLARPVARSGASPLGWRRGIALAGLQLLVVLGVARLVDSDQKNRSSVDVVNELAGNGVYEFFSAVRRNELGYERFYATVPGDEALARVRAAIGRDVRWIDPAAGGVERLVRAGSAERKLNIVLVSVESLGTEFVGAHGDARGLTPNLDRLAQQGLWFTNLYATGNRTVRGLEALSLALPPTPGQSIVRRPHNENLFSLGSVLEDKGYGVLFAYGGYGYFDNVNAFFDANDYRAIDRRDIPAERIEFENIWGVADEHLYDQVLEEIDREKTVHPLRPVFAHIMTTSNHRPYTYPAGRIDIPSGSGREGAVKYSDYALGRFVEKARSKPWFADTLFILTADHGASARGTMQIPVDKYRIPLVIYAPRHLKPRRVERLMSQIDIPPTVLGLLRFDYFSKFLGRDVLREPAATDRAFLANYQTLGYLKGGRMAVLQPKRKVEVFGVAPDGRVLGKVEDSELAREAIAFYQTASHLFRTGLYADEEQEPPERRVAARAGRP